MVDDGKLAAVLSEFARTVITDFPIQRILDHLVERVVDLLPVTAAGVTLIDAGKAPHEVAASDADALRFERLQTEIWEGPCLLAYESGRAVAAPDLASDDRFPRFGPAAVAAGLAAVFSFPLRHGDGRLGAMELYRDASGDLDASDMAVAQTLADVAAAYLLNAQSREQALHLSDTFHHRALHDPLTGLPNRLLLQERMEHAARRGARSHTNAAIIFVDLDRFKQVNDRHGHRVGDELLASVARRLARLIRPGDTLSRLSGDEFVFLCEDLRNADDVEVLLIRIRDAFVEPHRLGDAHVVVTASVGVAFAGPGEDISEDLVVRADSAMYEAKRNGGDGHHVIDRRTGRHASDLGAFERDLRAAVDDDGLSTVYQPIVRCADGLVTGVEVLLRWTHPTRGPISPMAMVEVAEQSDLIGRVGAWVLDRGCRERARWLEEHPQARLDLAVNVSARQLISSDFCATVVSVLARNGMDPAALVLEVTESVFVEDSARAIGVLDQLRGLGVRLALDDFGTGYSSLSYLQRLPIHIVKIDRTFVADIGRAPAGGAIIAAVANLAHVLGLAVVAEGVETQRHHDVVSAMGCESAQGHYYADAMPAAAIGAWLGREATGALHLPAPGDPVAVPS